MNVSKINATSNNVVTPKVEEKTTQKTNTTEGYAEKSAAPTNANLYKAMYNIQNKKADDEAYQKAMGEYLEKWGTPEQVNEFKKQTAPSNEKTKTEDDVAYQKAMKEYLEKWGTDEQLNEFYGEQKYPVNKAETQTTEKTEAKKSETKKTDEDAYTKAMREYLEKWGTPEQINEFEKAQEAKKQEKTEKSDENNDYYKQYQEYKHKYD